MIKEYVKSPIVKIKIGLVSLIWGVQLGFAILHFLTGGYMDEWATLSGFMTIIIPLVGFGACFHHYLLFKKSDILLMAFLSLVGLSDSFIYAMTALFGAWTMFQWPFWAKVFLDTIREPILVFNILIFMSLSNHIYNQADKIRGKDEEILNLRNQLSFVKNKEVGEVA